MTDRKAGSIKPKAPGKAKPLETGRLLRELMSEAIEVVEGGRGTAKSRTELLIRGYVANALKGNVSATRNVLKILQGDNRDLDLDDEPILMTVTDFAIAKKSGRIPRGASVRKNGKPLPDSVVEDVLRIRKNMTLREMAELYSALIRQSDPEY